MDTEKKEDKLFFPKLKLGNSTHPLIVLLLELVRKGYKEHHNNFSLHSASTLYKYKCDQILYL